MDKYLELVKKIILENIPKDEFDVFLFGSRADGTNYFASDIDIGVKGSDLLDKKIIYKIKDKIDESMVPFKVDIIDFNDVNETFKKEALKDIEIWNKSS